MIIQIRGIGIFRKIELGLREFSLVSSLGRLFLAPVCESIALPKFYVPTLVPVSFFTLPFKILSFVFLGANFWFSFLGLHSCTFIIPLFELFIFLWIFWLFLISLRVFFLVTLQIFPIISASFSLFLIFFILSLVKF